MGYRDLFAAREHNEMIEGKQKLFAFQIVASVMVALSAVAVWFINNTWEGFFPYTYFNWEFSFSNVLYFWPLFLWGFVLSIVTSLGSRSSYHDESLLAWSLVTGWMAATWEEFGYRWFYICFGMISVMLTNWLFGTVLGWGFAILFLVLAVSQFLDDEPIVGALLLLPFLLCVFFALKADPIYWLYGVVLMPLLNFVSFGAYGDIVDPTQYEALFIMGAIAANAWFRDGHKYQGLFGILNSWMAGFVLLYATLNYGLLTAVVIHGLWNSQIAIIRYITGKVAWAGNELFS